MVCIKRIDYRYRLLIEELKQEYISNNTFSKYMTFSENKIHIEDNPNASVIEESFSIKVTNYKNEHFKKAKKYDITSKFDQTRWHILLVPTGTLFAKNMIKLRKEWIEQYSIRGIITLKNSFFGVYTLPISVIVLGQPNNNIWLTSATSVDDILEILSNINYYKRKVYYTKSLNPENFMPEFYNEELKQSNENLDQYNITELKQIAEIIHGKNVEFGDFAEKGIPYLRATNIQNSRICNIDRFVSPKFVEKYAKQLLQEGDILLSKNPKQHKIARVNEDDLPAIASNRFFIIRAFMVPEDYLYQYFTSQTGKTILHKQLYNIKKGTVISSISMKDVEKLRVPIFDKATMLEMCNIEEANASEVVKSTPFYGRLLSYEDKLKKTNGVAFERNIYFQFLNAGWSTNEVLLESCIDSIQLKDNFNWIPDMILMNGDSKLAVVEAKSDLSLITPKILMILYDIIYNSEVPFVILATKGYFEIHSKCNSVIKKSSVVPTKEELLQLLHINEEV